MLAGAGTGLAPLYGIARDALAQGHTGPVWLFHGGVDLRGLYLAEELKALRPRVGELQEKVASLEAELKSAKAAVARLAASAEGDGAVKPITSTGDPTFAQAGVRLPAEVAEPTALFLENGIRFEADVIQGQKTGFFLDQRENRALVGELSRQADVLNAFSFSGGFSLYAGRGGARSVTDLDISPHALESGRRNWMLNQELAPVRSCRRHARATRA